MSAQTNLATYTFNEILDRIANCESEDDLRLYARLLNDEKKEYSLFHLTVLGSAIAIKQDFLIKGMI